MTHARQREPVAGTLSSSRRWLEERKASNERPLNAKRLRRSDLRARVQRLPLSPPIATGCRPFPGFAELRRSSPGRLSGRSSKNWAGEASPKARKERALRANPLNRSELRARVRRRLAACDPPPSQLSHLSAFAATGPEHDFLRSRSAKYYSVNNMPRLRHRVEPRLHNVSTIVAPAESAAMRHRGVRKALCILLNERATLGRRL